MTARVDHRARHRERIEEVLAGATIGADRVPYPIGLRDLEVLRTTRIGSALIRVTLGGEELDGFLTYAADDHVKFVLPGEDGVLRLPQRNGLMLSWPRDARPVTREYTVRRYDAAAGELDIDIALHDGGLGSTWAQTVTPGERLHVAGPPGGVVVPPVYTRYLLAGDITALPAIDRWLEELPRDAAGWALIEVADAGEEIPLDPPSGFEVHWLHRGAAAPGTSDVLERAVAALPQSVPEGERWYCWLAGEAGTLKPLRRWVADAWKLPRHDTDITGYWKRGVADFDEDDH
ncbi:FAD-binding 9 siderophore-interacting domain protein OS=Tsukamurella paurometabola (strain ATCC 8368/ DSM / CCUG 35730 / CIP 100753 / JCM 10117 / KCTC 9821 / NBRC 16120 / NCIMB 702349 / NCTC 13040) OX=521096 GN=Tpau_3687 PE=4 SV=1 [Tsukamurella paurometabola]|uniref:FAD-binding 9 siderophore-interacting domain protein n=1 Tax=Tsukamurella paurometabola (strain ATCC 8368 / DSM 20162 / CCUG 35730 / CIP 100753 / JCM 10117 / KCTC 9821 / NBRC 16120 / NCIMB 702349 / NCTC 13040) TaxID=521096 RepID=D5UY28_TSUPD|nr:siderophore-interacting protein [Tsukamurella paurometabola]ADG80265.1 FAD-binding 9 siderophore-interacting domain protein [Tsukamurella paurometabola DSM 20162]SUP39065.1 Vibriobactin utilization protein ViuB [Tsukamurella paurometabola]